MPRAKKTTTPKTQAELQKMEDDKKNLKILQSNLDMLEKSRVEAIEKKNFTVAKRIATAEEDVFGKMALIDEAYAKKAHKKVQTRMNSEISKIPGEGNENSDDIFDIMNDLVEETRGRAKQAQEEEEKAEEALIQEIEDNVEYGPYPEVDQFEDFDNNGEMYDVISLPSNGQCYPDKKNKIAVGFLTAFDENFITSPNLYRDGLVSEYLIKRKVVDKSIDTDKLCSGDADAILLFLRASSYGADYPAVFTDPETNEQFDVTIDLGQLKVKEFNLVGDENGWFEYVLPNTKDVIKFKFLTKKEEKQLDLMAQIEQPSTRLTLLRQVLGTLKGVIRAEDKYLMEDDKTKLTKNLESFNDWLKKLEDDKVPTFSKIITNRLEMMVMSVNGKTDKSYIRKYVRGMNAKDSLMLRRYMMANEPGIDFSITIDRPESLGGGSINTFLNWDDTVFLSLT